METLAPTTNRPLLIGFGPVTFSTCLEIVPSPLVIFDVNGYYRELGVHPRATRKELIEAYKAKDGQSSRRLTYVLMQLLDPEKRRRYDRAPMASLFHDKYVQEMLRRVETREIVEDIKAGRRRAEDIEMSAPFSVNAWEERADNPSETVVDTGPFEGQNQGNLSHPAANVWPYAFYVWRSAARDEDRMRQWQEVLCSVLGGRKESLEIAIGYHGLDLLGPVVISRVGYRLVVFLKDDKQPSEGLAQQVASSVESIE